VERDIDAARDVRAVRRIAAVGRMTAAPRRLRIGIDVRYLSHRLVGGVHTYVTRLVPEMWRAAPDDTFVLYADAKAPFELTPPAGVVVRTLPWRHAGSSVWNDHRGLARAMAADRVDVAFFPANYGFAPRGVASVITVHDAINLLPLRHTLSVRGHRQTLRSAAMTAYLHDATVRAVRRTTRLVTMSHYSRRTIVEACTRRPDDIDVVYHGAPPRIAVSPDDVRAAMAAHGLAAPYVLADGLKNPGVLVRAARRLPPPLRQALTLVFFARHADVLPVLADAVSTGEARLLVRPPTETLAALYAGAAVFAFPSWIEGFGIPLLEAMTYGAPIVASDRGAIPEVSGDAAMIVDAEDDAGMAAALQRLLTAPDEAERLRRAGAARVAGFTWQRSAEATLASLRRAHAAHAATTGAAAR
jgi:glycosyltransferase involved in cell wall biosynthesis